MQAALQTLQTPQSPQTLQAPDHSKPPPGQGCSVSEGDICKPVHQRCAVADATRASLAKPTRAADCHANKKEELSKVSSRHLHHQGISSTQGIPDHINLYGRHLLLPIPSTRCFGGSHSSVACICWWHKRCLLGGVLNPSSR